MIPGLAERLHGGATVVTASHRLAQRLQYQYAELRLSDGSRAWESPAILSWGAWLQALWSDYCGRQETPLLLNAAQQQAVWQEIILASPYAEHLPHSRAVAAQAITAWTLVQQWRLPVFSHGLYLNDDARAFTTWARAYRDRCRAHGWIDEAMLAGALARALRGRRLPVPGEVLYVGFDELTPQQSDLLTAVSASPMERRIPRAGSVCSASFEDAQSEITAAASWARTLLNRDPGATLGIVVPDLPVRRREVEVVLDDVLCPGALIRTPGSAQRPWSLAPGIPLAEYPPIATAMEILSLGCGPRSVAAAGAMLCSPYIKGAEQEAAARAALDAALRHLGEPRVSLRTLIYFAENADCPRLLEALRAFQQRLGALARQQRPQPWAREFSSTLSLFGWPGERALDSAEYQCLRAWREKVLRGLVSLDLVSAGMDLRTAVDEVRRLAGETAFQPETREAPVQVLGVSGAVAMEFDGMWVMGVHEEVWPRPARPNPFIPIKLQRQHGVPGCSPELALEQARRLTAVLSTSAPTVIFSWPTAEGDRELRPSPLLQPFARDTGLESAPRFEFWADRMQGGTAMEQFRDDIGPAVSTGSRVGGGAALFADQAACPFRAFARYRLHARGLDETDIGLDASDRGKLVHGVMQRFWQSVESQARLLKMDAGELDKAIAVAVEPVVADAARRRPATYTARFSDLERARLCRLAREWLELERSRRPFRVIACERNQAARFAGIDMETRIDRIDRTEDGGEVILDYKTGNQLNSRAWDGERPDEPQLPLYAIIADQVPAALALAGIRRGQCRFVGAAAAPDLLPGVEQDPDWPARIDQWQRVLGDLAAEFANGRADVAPKKQDTCRLCDLHSLCRVHELAAAADDHDET